MRVLRRQLGKGRALARRLRISTVLDERKHNRRRNEKRLDVIQACLEPAAEEGEVTKGKKTIRAFDGRHSW